VKTDPDSILELPSKQLQAFLIQYVGDLRDNQKSSTATMRLAIAAVQSFLLMNDVTDVNWRKIKKFMGEHKTEGEDRPYTRGEVSQLVNRAHSIRDKAIILLLASSGLRVGGFIDLRLKHLIAIKKYHIYKSHLSEI
jgi:integrase